MKILYRLHFILLHRSTLAFDDFLAKFEAKGYSIIKQKETELANWMYLEKETSGILFSGEDRLFIYYVNGDVTFKHINEFLKIYIDIFKNNNFDQDDNAIVVYSGSSDLKEFKKVIKERLSEDQYKLVMFEKIGDISKEKKKFENVKNNISDVFIVHGHNEEMMHSVARTIQSLDLKPIILHEEANKGRTIIEKLLDCSNVCYGIVLLSPDDEFNNDRDKQYRARQNVIFEMGLLFGKLGREKVAAIYKSQKSFEFPSDISGIVYIPYDNAGGWKMKLLKELKTCGIKVDANKMM